MFRKVILWQEFQIQLLNLFMMIEDEKDNEAIIQRNELADKFNCAPSQINYVLTTRFTC